MVYPLPTALRGWNLLKDCLLIDDIIDSGGGGWGSRGGVGTSWAVGAVLDRGGGAGEGGRGVAGVSECDAGPSGRSVEGW